MVGLMKTIVNTATAPHPYPLLVKNGEREIASVAASLLLPVTIRGEGRGGGMRGGADSGKSAAGRVIIQ